MSILKEILNIRYYQQYIKPYIQRIKQDGGVWKSETNTQLFYKMCKDYNIIDSIKFAWFGEAGGKLRTSGANQFWTKAYSLVTTNDATQTTSTSQPHIAGNIAPTEKLGMKNPNGSSNYMTHPTISFAANEAWSVTTVLNNNFINSVNHYYISGVGATSLLGLRNTDGAYRFSNSLGNSNSFGINTGLPDVGKNAIITVVANGLGGISLYINGVIKYTTSNFGIQTSFVFARIFYNIAGSISSHIIRAQALTPTQVAAEANFLRSLYPEIPSVTIGSQVWATSNCDMVATPLGNLIQNVTLNTNVEKITNAADREFTSDTGFWDKGAGTTISSGLCNINTAVPVNALIKSSFLESVKWYKYSFTVSNYISGTINISGLAVSANGSYVVYATNRVNILFFTTGCNLSIDNISVEEVGWSDSTNLYNYVYANTTGTVEQKTYAAVKAAAMWCYYNNDAALGAIYNKLYNWYAVKLLQMDIDYYNAANPSTPWGWRVPTDTDFNTLATALGGASVAGGKMKKEGTVYWASPNTGADNSSGFSGIGAGDRINSSGVFDNILSSCFLWTINNSYYTIRKTTVDVIFAINGDARFGFSLRLIKS